jgi:cytochrome c553
MIGRLTRFLAFLATGIVLGLAQSARPRALGAQATRRGITVTWKRIVGFVAAFIVLEAIAAVAGAVLFAWVGFYDVAATADHWPITRWFLHFAMKHSVAFHAGRTHPPNLDDPVLITRGAAYFRIGCAPCHGEPGGVPSPIARGMTPVPPRLEGRIGDFRPDELHWIVKNGVKMTAMPAWPAQTRNDEVWAMVAFLKAMPAMKASRFDQLAFWPQAEASPFPVCASCHGADGNGRDGAFPEIAGLNADYIAIALREYRNGNRQSGFMQPAAANLSDADIAKIAAYYSTLGQPQQPPATTPAPAK